MHGLWTGLSLRDAARKAGDEGRTASVDAYASKRVRDHIIQDELQRLLELSRNWTAATHEKLKDANQLSIDTAEYDEIEAAVTLAVPKARLT